MLSAAAVQSSPFSVTAAARADGGALSASPRTRHSLSEVEILPWLCCMFPPLTLFSFMGFLFVLFFFSAFWFNLALAFINGLAVVWGLILAGGCYVCKGKVRKGVQTDWDALFENLQAEEPKANEVLHIVVLPNFKESENMMLETLINLAISPLARTRTRVVLAMEAREGPAAKEKADRLIQKTSHLFADVFATYHPADLPGECIGKSSNAQWGYRAALQQYAPILLGCDPSCVLITVGDADTLWHPHYLSALSYTALTMSAEQRSWKIFQPPIVLGRNFWSVPALTRVCFYGTIIFEFASVGTHYIFPSLSYSAYSLTLALASHQEVDGWDVDVIAEDHHMYIKCFFAALWGQANTNEAGKTKKQVGIDHKLSLEGIYLPALCYSVEAESMWSSMTARFQQARRHAQGTVELGYLMLQYLRLTKAVGVSQVLPRTHSVILRMILKLMMMHVLTLLQAWCCLLCIVSILIPNILNRVLSGGLLSTEGRYNSMLDSVADLWGSMDVSQQTAIGSLLNFSWVPVFFSVLSVTICVEMLNGDWYRLCKPLAASHLIDRVEEDTDKLVNPAAVEKATQRTISPNGVPLICCGVSALGIVHLSVKISCEMMIQGQAVLFVYVLFPGILASWSMLRTGTKYEYIVAPKPE